MFLLYLRDARTATGPLEISIIGKVIIDSKILMRFNTIGIDMYYERLSVLI